MTDKEFQDRLINELQTMGIGQKKWHSDKGVPIAVLLMFAGQLTWAAWYGSSVASEVKSNTTDIAEIKKTTLTTEGSALLRKGIEQNSKDIYKNNVILRDNGKALTRLQRTIDRYLGAKINENER